MAFFIQESFIRSSQKGRHPIEHCLSSTGGENSSFKLMLVSPGLSSQRYERPHF
jgi:hypothetical protein